MKNLYISSFKNKIIFELFKKAIFLLVGLALFGIIGLVTNSFFPVKLREHELLSYFSDKKLNKYELVAFGNSHIKAIDIDSFKKNSKSLVLPNIDLYTILTIGKNIIDSSPNLKILIMPTSEDYVLLDHRYLSYKNPHIEIYAMLSIAPWDLPLKNWVEWSSYLEEWLYHHLNLYYLMRPDNWKDVFDHIFKVDGENDDFVMKIENRYEIDPFDRKHVKHTIKSRIKNSINNINTINLDGLYERIFVSIDDLIRSAKKNNTKIIFFYAPLSKTYLDEYTKQSQYDVEKIRIDSKYRWIKFMNKYSKSIGCVNHIDDIWDIEIDGINPKYFYDSHHLNEFGSKHFTKKLKKRLTALPRCEY